MKMTAKELAQVQKALDTLVSELKHRDRVILAFRQYVGNDNFYAILKMVNLDWEQKTIDRIKIVNGQGEMDIDRHIDSIKGDEDGR